MLLLSKFSKKNQTSRHEMPRPFYAVFVAGGSGARMGSELPKQFIEIEGIPILRLTIERFLGAVPGARVITVLPQAWTEFWRELCHKGDAVFSQTLVSGGLTRFHSVRNALEKIPDGAIASIHDGVRPLASTEMISGMARRAQYVPALIPATPVTDTLRSTDGSPAPDRGKLLSVQTPQMFWSEKLRTAYRRAYDTAFTDDASVAESAGIPIEIYPGERTNIKITTPEDLEIAKALLSLQRP